MSASTVKYELIISIALYESNLSLLRETLNCVLTTKLNIKLVLIDNSKRPVPVKFFADFPCDKIEYLHNQENIGFAKAHNIAIRQYVKHCEFYLILNPDISFPAGTLENLVEKMRTDPQIGLCIPKILYPDNTPQYVNKRLPTPLTSLLRPLCRRFPAFNKLTNMKRYECRDMDHGRSIICPSISGCMMFCRAEVLAEVEGFDERYFLYFEDIDLSRRIAERYLTVAFHDITAHHHWQRAAYADNRLFKVLINSAKLYFHKFGWFFDPRRRELNQVRYY